MLIGTTLVEELEECKDFFCLRHILPAGNFVF